MSTPRLIVFDLGGVIVRICRSWREACERIGLECRVDADEPARREQHLRCIEAHQTGRMAGDEYARRVSAILDGGYTPDEIMQVHCAWTMDEYDGVATLIDDIHRAGLTTAALSNTNHEHWQLIMDGPAFLRIQHPLASHHLGLHKPDLAIYRALETRLGFAGPDIIFFDDSAENVVAARNAGWQAHEIDPLGAPDQQMRALLAPVLESLRNPAG